MEVGRRRRAADLKSQQSHLVVNSLLNGHPVTQTKSFASVNTERTVNTATSGSSVCVRDCTTTAYATFLRHL